MEAMCHKTRHLLTSDVKSLCQNYKPMKEILKHLIEEGLITKRFIIFVLIIFSVVSLSIWGNMDIAVAGNILIAVIHFYRDEIKGKID